MWTLVGTFYSWLWGLVLKTQVGWFMWAWEESNNEHRKIVMKANLVSGQSSARGLGLELAVKFSLSEFQNSKFWILNSNPGCFHPCWVTKPSNPDPLKIESPTVAGTRESDGFTQLMAPRAGAPCAAIWETSSSSRILEWNKCRIPFFTLLLRLCGLRQAGTVLGQYFLWALQPQGLRSTWMLPVTHSHSLSPSAFTHPLSSNKKRLSHPYNAILPFSFCKVSPKTQDLRDSVN